AGRERDRFSEDARRELAAAKRGPAQVEPADTASSGLGRAVLNRQVQETEGCRRVVTLKKPFAYSRSPAVRSRIAPSSMRGAAPRAACPAARSRHDLVS